MLLLLDLSKGKETTLVSVPPSRVNNLLSLVPGITVDGERWRTRSWKTVRRQLPS